MLSATASCLRRNSSPWAHVLQLCQLNAQHPPHQQHQCPQQLSPAYLRQPETSCFNRSCSTHSKIASIHQSGIQLKEAAGQPAGASSTGREPQTPLLHAIRNRIMIRGGPLSVAEYMQEVLTNPSSGYYMKRDVFGTKGDFTTSPEISQMFGEMLGIWCVVLWQQLGCPSKLQLVELGPGRGTLMADLLRGTAAFKPFADALQVHLVEVSPFLRSQQWQKLSCSSASGGSTQQPESGVSALNGAQITWHTSLDAVPAAGPCIYIAHEFLDALPVHHFVRDPRRGWLEVMVDTVDGDAEDTSSSGSTIGNSSSPTPAVQQSYEGIPMVQTQPVQLQKQSRQQQGSAGTPDQGSAPSDQGLHLRFVLSPNPTPAAQLLVQRRLEALEGTTAQQTVQQQGQQQELRHAEQHKQEASQQPGAIEIGAQAMAVVESLARRIAASGGAALLIDYGANKPYTNSLTGIRNHQGVHPLSEPGTADLSAWVDFSAVRMAAEQAFDIQPPTPNTSAHAAPAAAGAAGGTAAEGTGVAEASSSAGGCEEGSGAGVEVFGPVTQAHLLHSLGIQARLQSLTEAATPNQAEELISGYQRLVDTGPGGMGASYLAMAVVYKGAGVPVGFEQQPEGQHGGAA